MYNSHMKMHNTHMIDFYTDIELGEKKIEGRFVIPSGIRCASASTIERYFGIESVGIITTKSINVDGKAGYREPLYVKYGENSYINAVGLSNPGADAFKKELARICVPNNKFLLVSIFGKDEDEFYGAANILSDYADGFELNVSCPHAKGYGLQIGNDVDLVSKITKKISSSFNIPVFVKLSATIPEIARVAKMAIKNGATGITAINTIGPSIEYVSDMPVLSNREGGMSGESIRPMGLKAVLDIRREIGNDPIIIGMGGIFNKKDIESYNKVGADFFGIGSALTNLDSEEAKIYLNTMRWDLIRERDAETYTLEKIDNMYYSKCTIEDKTVYSDTLYKIRVSKWKGYDNIEDVAGKFFFIMITEIGEKPFALYSYEDREFVIKKIGPFTKELTKLKIGDTIYIRGPYGKEIKQYKNTTINIVAGGTGISPSYEIAKKYCKDNKIRFFFGGKTTNDIFEQEKFNDIGELNIITEEGSISKTGFVSDLLSDYEFPEEEQVFINVGPKPMIEKAYEIQKKIAGEENIWVSIEYQTSCGVGICGKCSTEMGAVSCVDGPFLKVEDALKIETCLHN